VEVCATGRIGQLRSAVDRQAATYDDGVVEPSDPYRRRVFVPHALGADEFLRVTWHDSRQIAVFSIWSGSECTAAVPVRVSGLSEVASVLNGAVGNQDNPAWPAPDPASMVVPAAGFQLRQTRTA